MYINITSNINVFHRVGGNAPYRAGKKHQYFGQKRCLDNALDLHLILQDIIPKANAPNYKRNDTKWNVKFRPLL